MTIADSISSHKCARCHLMLGTRNIAWENGLFFHKRCLREGYKQLHIIKKMPRHGIGYINAMMYMMEYY